MHFKQRARLGFVLFLFYFYTNGIEEGGESNSRRQMQMFNALTSG